MFMFLFGRMSNRLNVSTHYKKMGCKYIFKSDRLGFRNWELYDFEDFAKLNDIA